MAEDEKIEDTVEVQSSAEDVAPVEEIIYA